MDRDEKPTDEPNAARPPKAVLTLDEQIAAIDGECKFRQIKVRQAKSMKDVAHLGAVVIRGEATSRQSEIRGLKQLHLACEARMRELIGGHMLELRNLRDLTRFIQMRSHYQHREWVFLKGSYPMLFREADGEAERIERHLARENEQQNQRRKGS